MVNDVTLKTAEKGVGVCVHPAVCKARGGSMPETCINNTVATLAPLPKAGFLINPDTTWMHKHKNKHTGMEGQSEKAPQTAE